MSEKCETNGPSLDKNSSAQSLKELFVLLCCKDSLCIYPAKSVVQVSLFNFKFSSSLIFFLLNYHDMVFQGQSKSVHKVKLSKPCCWATVFRKGGTVCGLVVFYQTGEMEIRYTTSLSFLSSRSLHESSIIIHRELYPAIPQIFFLKKIIFCFGCAL